ncbi:MAG: hypothetical protein SP1CHLAM54_09180 [Chlamydiia bacterium]|nr:hypothetical protein [Chlamydiia bacterium]MCH9615824.1 hypothetical protein [Chlamydiia bacterium]
MKEVQNMTFNEMMAEMKKLSESDFLTPNQKTIFSNSYESFQAASKAMQGDEKSQGYIKGWQNYLKGQKAFNHYKNQNPIL